MVCSPKITLATTDGLPGKYLTTIAEYNSDIAVALRDRALSYEQSLDLIYGCLLDHDELRAAYDDRGESLTSTQERLVMDRQSMNDFRTILFLEAQSGLPGSAQFVGPALDHTATY